jgi:hypothetical protein
MLTPKLGNDVVIKILTNQRFQCLMTSLTNTTKSCIIAYRHDDLLSCINMHTSPSHEEGKGIHAKVVHITAMATRI